MAAERSWSAALRARYSTLAGIPVEYDLRWYQRQRARAEVVDRFRRLRAEGGRIDLERIGRRGPASTWTYLVNDNPFASFWVSLIAPGNAGTSMAGALLAVMYWPVTAVAAAVLFVRRALRSRPAQEGGDPTGGE